MDIKFDDLNADDQRFLQKWLKIQQQQGAAFPRAEGKARTELLDSLALNIEAIRSERGLLPQPMIIHREYV